MFKKIYFSGANQPCKHLGTGPGVMNSVLPISFNVLAQSTNKPTLFAESPPHTIDASMTPSSSAF